ncbi:Uncharacterised protein [Mycobacteroides abscessus subsp. abscessus]|nr:Uncharacterised protein [Mycobacteroides abscessus subsp. abscessus]
MPTAPLAAGSETARPSGRPRSAGDPRPDVGRPGRRGQQPPLPHWHARRRAAGPGSVRMLGQANHGLYRSGGTALAAYRLPAAPDGYPSVRRNGGSGRSPPRGDPTPNPMWNPAVAPESADPTATRQDRTDDRATAPDDAAHERCSVAPPSGHRPTPSADNHPAPAEPAVPTAPAPISGWESQKARPAEKSRTRTTASSPRAPPAPPPKPAPAVIPLPGLRMHPWSRLARWPSVRFQTPSPPAVRHRVRYRPFPAAADR